MIQCQDQARRNPSLLYPRECDTRYHHIQIQVDSGPNSRYDNQGSEDLPASEKRHRTEEHPVIRGEWGDWDYTAD